MASQSWANLLNAGAPWQTTAGTALTTSASTATISPQAAGSTNDDFVLPGQPNGLQFYPGMTLKIDAAGTLASAGTTSNLTVFLACGVSGTLATSLGTTGAYTLGAGTVTNVEWSLHAFLRVIAISRSASTLTCEGALTTSGIAGSNAATLGTANGNYLGIPLTTTAFNTYTGGTALGLRATLSAAFGTVQCNSFLIWQTS